ncbi:MAG TPA: branched-chain amino acid ABC transporter permease, partial [Candidatus Olsenella pullicola]|nr:branched-chain amino acid ABC transporter permease [Candidatus Olsenella pullicola]
MEEELMAEKRPIISTGGRGPAPAGKRRSLPMAARYAINALLVLLVLVVGELMIDGGAVTRYQTSVLQQVGVYIIMAVSLNVATGYLGQLPLGHAGFMSVGAYGCAIFIMRLTETLGMTGRDVVAGGPLVGLIVFAGVVFGGICAAVAGVIIGIPALRLKGDYLAIITLAFAEIIRVVMLNIDDVLGFELTRGAAGLTGIPSYSNFLNVFLAVAVVCFLVHTMMKSRHGRAILAIRDN